VNEREKPGYWAVIPAAVRYDEELKPSARLLYAEISARTNAKGYCWTTNETFADLFGLSVGTVSRLISQLEKKGYVRCEMATTAKGSERRIYAGIFNVSVEQGGIDENDNTPSCQKRQGGIDENVKTLQYKNNIINNIPPISPYEGDVGGECPSKPKPKPKERCKPAVHYKPVAFASLYDFYPRHVGRQAAQKAWDKLRPSPEVMSAICDAMKIQKAYWEAVGTPKDKIPHLATWLNGRRWEDDPDEYMPDRADNEGGGWAPDPEVM